VVAREKVKEERMATKHTTMGPLEIRAAYGLGPVPDQITLVITDEEGRMLPNQRDLILKTPCDNALTATVELVVDYEGVRVALDKPVLDFRPQGGKHKHFVAAPLKACVDSKHGVCSERGIKADVVEVQR
jgi:hypothetical protein